MSHINYCNLNGTWHSLPRFFILFIHHIRPIFGLSYEFPKMVCVFHYKFDWPFSSVASNSKIKPVFGLDIKTNIRVPLKFNNQGIIIDYVSRWYISCWEAAIQNNITIKLKIRSIGMPSHLFIFLLLCHSKNFIY